MSDIFILGTPEETAQALDDKTLGEMIAACAQTLCNAQCEITLFDGGYSLDWKNKPPLGGKDINNELSQWARECRANYLELVKYAIACCVEYYYRLDSFDSHYSNLPKEVAFHNKYKDVIAWCADNVPSLPDGEKEFLSLMGGAMWREKVTPMPLVMPDKYQKLAHYNPDNWNTSEHIDNVIYAYRNYYRAKVWKKLEKCNSIFESPNEISGGCKENNNEVEIKWTRRTKPQWLGDL
jgi:hypothetical protein